MKFPLRRGFVIELLVNAFLPWLVYTLAQPEMGRVHALMASAIPPIAWSVIQFAQKRQIDAFSIFVLAGIGLSLAAFFGSGSYRMLELREHLVNGVFGMAFLGSVAIKRPLLLTIARALAKRKSQEEAGNFERQLNNPRVLRLLTRLTLGIGFIMLIQTAIAVSLVFTLPVREFLIVSPIVSYALLGLIAGVVLLYVRPEMRAVFAQAKLDQKESKV